MSHKSQQQSHSETCLLLDVTHDIVCRQCTYIVHEQSDDDTRYICRLFIVNVSHSGLSKIYSVIFILH